MRHAVLLVIYAPEPALVSVAFTLLAMVLRHG
jgi:hypothetical protein